MIVMRTLNLWPLGKASLPHLQVFNKHLHSTFKHTHSNEAYRKLAKLDEEAWLEDNNKRQGLIPPFDFSLKDPTNTRDRCTPFKCILGRSIIWKIKLKLIFFINLKNKNKKLLLNTLRKNKNKIIL
jgi:hypothetical protein